MLGREGLRLTRSDQVITYVARNLEPYRGFHIFMRTLPEILSRHPSAHVLIVGGDGLSYSDPPPYGATYREMLLAEVGDKLFLSRVHFLGKQERVSELLALADLFLMPSELESFGLAALEAMACKVPTIATRVGGVPELIDDGVTGLLYPVGDVEGMAAGALSLLNDPPRLKAMREAARQTAQKRFCANLVVPRYVRYYEQVLAGKGRETSA